MFCGLYITNLTCPSALVGPGGWLQRMILPSFFTGTKPGLPATSWVMLGGTSQDGLSITPTAVADSCGVGVLVAPAIARCFQRLTPFSTKVAWKPGTLTMIYFCPRSRGSQRQRSMFSRIRLIFAVSLVGVVSSADLSAAYGGWVGSSALSAAVSLCCAIALRSSASASKSSSLTNHGPRAAFL